MDMVLHSHCELIWHSTLLLPELMERVQVLRTKSVNLLRLVPAIRLRKFPVLISTLEAMPGPVFRRTASSIIHTRFVINKDNSTDKDADIC